MFIYPVVVCLSHVKCALQLLLLLLLLLTSVKIHINDKTNYKNQSLQLGLFIPNSKQNI